jgi:hypothetical protein
MESARNNFEPQGLLNEKTNGGSATYPPCRVSITAKVIFILFLSGRLSLVPLPKQLRYHLGHF